MGELFIQELNHYFGFNNDGVCILDAKMFIQYFLFSVSLVFLTLPKRIDRKAILWGLLKFAILFLAYVFGESLFFAFSYAIVGQAYGGLIFTISFIIFPIAFLIPTTKDYPLHKAIKTSIMVASLMITAELGRGLGAIAGVAPDKPLTFLGLLASTAPMLFLPFIGFVLYRYNITRFRHLPTMNVVMIFILASFLTISAVWANRIDIKSFVNEGGTDVETYSADWLFIFLSSVELLILVGLYYSIYSLVDYRHRITELEVASSVLTVEKESLLIDIKNREELMKIRHDLQNQLSYMSVLLNDGKYEEAKQYIQSLTEQKEEYLYSFSCSNLVISGIVNLELTKAKIANKKIKFKVVVPPKLPFEDSDLLSLITNIVDNSLENFVSADDKDVINVSIVTQQDYLRITSFNSVDQNTVKLKPTLKTTKRDRGHGYGTKIIKNIVKKYEGYVTFTFEDNKFVCDCMINMNHKGNNNA